MLGAGTGLSCGSMPALIMAVGAGAALVASVAAALPTAEPALAAEEAEPLVKAGSAAWDARVRRVDRSESRPAGPPRRCRVRWPSR